MTRQQSSVLIFIGSGLAVVAPIALVLYLGVNPLHAAFGFLSLVCGVSVLALHLTRKP